VLVLDIIEILPPLGKYKYDTWRIHEAMDDGGVAAEMVSGNSSSEAVGAGKVASWAPLFGP
jgi:hypothetical protein